MAKYLITGAAGFIGSRVADMLLADGHQIVGVDSLNDAYDPRMKHYRLKFLQDRPGFSFHQIDIADRQEVCDLDGEIDGADAIINLAARAGVRSSVENPWVYYDTNVTGTLNLLESCKRLGIKKFVVASSSSVYGADAPLPTPEEIETDHPLQPYAASKKAAETLCYSYHYLFGLDVSVFRYFTVYGPAGRPDMVMFRFAQWIAEDRPVRLNGDGTQARAFTYVDDIARGTIAGLRPLGYEVINLGGHELVTINELIEMLEELIGKKASIELLPRHPADMMANQADVSKAARLLDWKPQVPLADGVRRLVDWYMRNREWAQAIDTQ